MASMLCRKVIPMLSVYTATRSIHLSQKHGAVWFMAPIARIAVAIGGRLARTAWKRLPAEKKKTITAAISRRKRWLWAAGLVSVSGGCYYYYSHVESTPLTQRRRFMMYSRDDIRKILVSEGELEGGEYLQLFTDLKAALPATNPRYKQVTSTLRNILRSNSWCEELVNVKGWRVIVVEDANIVNAISLPTGDIIVYTGLLDRCRNQDELGLIMGHEVAHVVLNHGSETLSHTGLVSFLGLFVIGAIWLVLPSDLLSFFMHKAFTTTTKALLENPYSQQLEFEADRVGLMFASKACYSPSKSVAVWQHLPEVGGEVYLSTHPGNEERLAMLTALLPVSMELYNESNCITQGLFSSFKKIIFTKS